jgi:hypothetical protein
LLPSVVEPSGELEAPDLRVDHYLDAVERVALGVVVADKAVV